MSDIKLTATQFLFRLGIMSGCVERHNELTYEQCFEVREYAMALLSENKKLTEKENK